MRVVLVVPCFNEAERLPVDRFRSFSLAGHQFEFLFVNDGSTDGTAAVLDDLCRAPTMRSIALEKNSGKAEAVRQGMLGALAGEADLIGYWDADLATPLSALPAFCHMFEAQPELELAYGARVRMLGHRIERQTYRHVYGRAFALAVSRLLRLPVYDSQCGAKLFRVTPELGQVFAEPFLSRWIFDVEILARFVALWERRGLEVDSRMVEVPLERWHHVDGSKVGLLDAAWAALELARIGRRYHADLSGRRRRFSGLPG